jgi:hypothetical protein
MLDLKYRCGSFSDVQVMDEVRLYSGKWELIEMGDYDETLSRQ